MMKALSVLSAMVALVAAGACGVLQAAADPMSAPARVEELQRQNALLRRENAALRERARLQTENASLRERVRSPTESAAPPERVWRREPQGVPQLPADLGRSPMQDYAADMLVPKAVPVPMAPRYSWTGFYFGGHFGGAWTRSDWQDLFVNPFCEPGFPCPPTDVGFQNAVGVMGGGQIGLNWQSGPWVLGVEAAYSFADLTAEHQNVFLSGLFPVEDVSVTFQQTLKLLTQTRAFGTIAARVGLASDLFDRTLFYVKGGAAVAWNQYEARRSFVLTSCPEGEDCFNIPFESSHTGSKTRWGWMAGIGLEYGLFDNVSAMVEYNYLDFGGTTVELSGLFCTIEPLGGCAATTEKFRVDQKIHAIKFGLNLRFNAWAPPY